MSDSIVSIRNICKRFDSVMALDDVSIEIRSGEIFALLGPSGCGKSTLLRLISGFESPSSGELLLDGKDMTMLAPNKRPINMVFQSYAVFPHMSVEKNVAYGLKMEKRPEAEINLRVSAALEQVHLQDYASRMPDQLSGGQRQRVALARALVKKPRVLLLDEPLSALDAKLRDAMRLELVKLQETVGITFIIVTHDQAEAMAMADRIAVLESGKLRQVASPEELYSSPADAFVADFIGNINTFDVLNWSHSEGQLSVHAQLLNSVVLDITDPPACLGALGSKPDAVLAIRPEHISVSRSQPKDSAVSLMGTLGDIAFQGQHCIVEIRLENDTSTSAIIDNELAESLRATEENERIWAFWDAHKMLLLPRKAN